MQLQMELKERREEERLTAKRQTDDGGEIDLQALSCPALWRLCWVEEALVKHVIMLAGEKAAFKSQLKQLGQACREKNKGGGL